MKKSLAILVLLFFVLGTFITITNFSTKAVALVAPEVEGWWQDDPSCGPGGWRCWECPCHTCWCRDVSSGQCC